MKTILLFLLQFGFVFVLTAQPADDLNKTLEELDNHIEALIKQKDMAGALHYFGIYTQKAKAEKDTEALVYGYRSMAIWQSALPKKLQYADSAIAIARHSKNNELIGSAIYTKGIVYYKFNDWDNSLTHYLLSDEYISQTENKYLEHKIKYALAQAQYRLGNYQQALPSIEACVSYFGAQNDKKNQKGYLNSLQLLAILHNRVGNYQKCSEVNWLGLIKAEAFSQHKMKIRFINSEAINKYSLGLYKESLDDLQKYLPDFAQQNNDSQQILSWFFMGKNYLALGENQKAISCFEKVDVLFAQTGYLRDDMAENYYYLIEDAQKKEDLKRELHYTQRLIEAQQLLSTQYKNITVRITKYNTENLLASKDRIEKALKQKEARNTWLIVGFSMMSVGFLLFVIRHIRYKRKFEVLYRQFMEAQKERSQPVVEILPPIAVEVQTRSSSSEINAEVVKKILKGLDQFEANRAFLKADLTMAKLAKSLKTNVKYLSIVIQDYKHTDYVRYINQLRVDYLTDLLKSQKYQYYSIEGYAKELGFNSAKGFNKAFLETTGMKFSEFFKKFQKENGELLPETAEVG